MGVWQAEHFEAASQSRVLRTSIVFAVMFAMALSVSFKQVKASFADPRASILATLLNLLALPILTWMFVIVFAPNDFGGWMAVAIVPCTLASAAVWTRKAGGDDTIAMMVTLISSSTCFFVAPLWLSLTIQKEVQIDGWVMGLDLFLTVLLPMILAQLITQHQKISKWTTDNRSKLAVFCQFGILLMVFLGAVQIGIKSASSGGITWESVLVTILLAAAIHMTTLGLGWWLAKRLGFPRAAVIAIAIAGSQKTLMIGLKIAADCELTILPMVTYHVVQLILDAMLVEYWSRHSIREPGG